MPTILEITQKGRVTLGIRPPIKVPKKSFDALKREWNIRLMIIPASDSSSILEAEDYKFDWNITEFNQTEIVILVNFTTPGHISTMDYPDRLRVLFNNTSEFMVPLDDNLEVMPNGIQVLKSIPP